MTNVEVRSQVLVPVLRIYVSNRMEFNRHCCLGHVLLLANTSATPCSILRFSYRVEEPKWRSANDVSTWSEKMHGEFR